MCEPKQQYGEKLLIHDKKNTTLHAKLRGKLSSNRLVAKITNCLLAEMKHADTISKNASLMLNLCDPSGFSVIKKHNKAQTSVTVTSFRLKCQKLI